MTIGNSVAILRQKFAASIGLPFAEILSESEIESTLEEEGVSYRKRLFCPIVTLFERYIPSFFSRCLMAKLTKKANRLYLKLTKKEREQLRLIRDALSTWTLDTYVKCPVRKWATFGANQSG